jgi:uroporphyrin-III C-methyltransferase / precorrin-2 dehydrogenase / sirohydrochlorin ferrochelatase
MSDDKNMAVANSPQPVSDDANAPRYLTLCINMAGMRCLLVGGGSVGARKATTLADAGAELTVVAPEISAPVKQLVAAGRIQWRQAEYDAAMLEGVVLVVAATDDEALNLRIGADAQQRGILSCTASAARSSRVIFPAVYTGEEVTVAVHSHGRACLRSQQVRNEIAAWLEEQSRQPQN